MTMAIKKILHFITTGIWRIRLREMPPRKSFLIRFLRVCILSTREFFQDKCVLRASALTYYTLLSIVPVLAMAFGIAKGFGLQDTLERLIREKMQALDASTQLAAEAAARTAENAENATEAAKTTLESNAPLGEAIDMQRVADLIIEFTNNMLENVQGGLVAGIGIVILFYVTIKVLANIERSFNDIWGVSKARSLPRKFADYLAFMLISPICFVMASSITVMITTRAQGIIEGAQLWGWADSLAASSLRLVPLSIIWLLFAFTYLFMPNTKVRPLSGLIGGIAAGTLFYLVQSLYVSLQIGVSRNSAIYGSFAALPFLLLWLQTSWLIVLFGAEIAFAHQNIDTYEFEPDCRNASHFQRRVLALRIMQYALDRFEANKEAPTAEELSHELETPIRLIREVLKELTDSRIMTRIPKDGKRSPVFQPGMDPKQLTLAFIIQHLDDHGTDKLPATESETQKRIEAAILKFRKLADKSEENIHVTEL